MKIIFVILIVLLSACSRVSLKAKLASYPEGASVGVQNREGKITPLGVTPLEAELTDPISEIVFSKAGFKEERIIVAGGSNSIVNVTAKLTSANDLNTANNGARFERLARDVLRANQMIGKKSYSEARSILSSLTSEFPYVSVTYDLLGNVSYLERDTARALTYYEKSLTLNPENIETRRMVERLKGSP